MTVYYNDNDPYVARWLRNLVAAGHLPAGDVDDRSITDVQPQDLEGYTAVHLFAGIGGWPLALELAGWPDARPLWTASCPCPPFSVAGRSRVCPECSGTAPVWHPARTGVAVCAACYHEWEEDERHLWPEVLRLIAGCRPAVVFGEQVAGIGGLDWLAGVRGSLELGGYALGAFVAPAASVGAPHRRERTFWVANARYVDGWCGRPEQVRRLGQEGRTGSLEYPGAPRGVADAERDRTSRPSQRSGSVLNIKANERTGQEHVESRADGAFDIVGDTAGTRLERCTGDGDGGDESRRFGTLEDGHLASAGGAGGVGDTNRQGLDGTDVHLRSGRPRQASSGVAGSSSASAWGDFDVIPFVTGEIRRVESGTFPLADGVPQRVGRLRAYGNSVVPQLAAEFVRAYMRVIFCAP